MTISYKPLIISYSVLYVAMLISTFILNKFTQLDSFWNFLYVDFIGTFVIFFYSVYYRNTNIYDLYWSLPGFGFVAHFITHSDRKLDQQQLLAITPYLVFCIRHLYQYFFQFRGIHHIDFRYEAFLRYIKNPFLYWTVSLIIFHIIPTLIVITGLLPLYYTLNENQIPNQLIFNLGIIVQLLAVFIEYIADEQLNYWRSKKDNKGKCINVGLWKYSRHPNYFGETLFWFGLYLTILSYGSKYIWTILGPFIILSMFVGSTIKLMEDHLLIDRPEYIEYQQSVNTFIPWFPKKSIKDI